MHQQKESYKTYGDLDKFGSGHIPRVQHTFWPLLSTTTNSLSSRLGMYGERKPATGRELPNMSFSVFCRLASRSAIVTRWWATKAAVPTDWMQCRIEKVMLYLASQSVWIIKVKTILVSTWHSDELGVFDSQLYHRSFQKKALQQCTPWKFLSLLPHALLPNTAALTSLIGFTVTKWQAPPKLIKCSQLQTCSDGPLTFQIPL